MKTWEYISYNCAYCSLIIIKRKFDVQFHVYKCTIRNKHFNTTNIIISMTEKPSNTTYKDSIEKLPQSYTGFRDNFEEGNSNYTTYMKRNVYKIKRDYYSWVRELKKVERYSVGDYLRQQILQDFCSADIFSKTQEQIAEDRYNRVRHFLNYRDGLLNKMRWFNIKSRNCSRAVTKNIDNNIVIVDVSRSYMHSKQFKKRLMINYDRINYRRGSHRKSYGDRLNWHFVCCWDKEERKKMNNIFDHTLVPSRSFSSIKNLSNLDPNYMTCNDGRNDLLLLDSRQVNIGTLKNEDSEKSYESSVVGFEDSNETTLIAKSSIHSIEPIIYKLQISEYILNDSNMYEIGKEPYSVDSNSTDTKTNAVLSKFHRSCHCCHMPKRSKTLSNSINQPEMGIVSVPSSDNAIHCSDCRKLYIDQQKNIVDANYFCQVYQLLRERSRQKQQCSRTYMSPINNEDPPDDDNVNDGNGIYLHNGKSKEITSDVPHSIRRDNQGEEALVSTVVGRPSIPYSHHIKNNPIDEGRQCEHDVISAPIIVKSKINVRDITKYFNYPNKEKLCEYGVNHLRNIGDETMGSNFSRHHGKGLTGRRTQSSGNLCDPQGKLNDVSKMFVPCSNTSEERYNITGSLPNNLDNDKQSNHIDNLIDNNNIELETTDGNIGANLTQTKSYHQVKFYDRSTIGMELVKYHSHDSLKGDPWKYQQNGEMDPVRCQHGNFKPRIDSQISVYPHAFTLENSNNYYHGETEMSDIGQGSKTLPIRRIDPKWCDPISIRAIHQKNSIDIVDGHQSDCQLVIHRQRERLANVTAKPLISGEHHNQDQGYASERSPEDEHPMLLSGQSLIDVNAAGRTFRIILQKSSRGLGLSVSGGGTAGPVRVKRLFPQQPAALSNQLKPGDMLLAVNGISLSGLTNYEALEVLRTTSNTVELLVCRPAGETSITPPGEPPTPPARRKLPSPTLRLLNPIPPLHIEPCGEFDIEMTKVDGSLGFTLRKVDSSALGHYVRALVREPALSDGRIQPGDKIVAVDDALLSPMSHEEAVSLLRQCGPKVKLRLYRDLAQTPVSALSPTEPDHPLRPSHTSLRQEAVDMLCDLAVRKLSPTTSNGSGCQYHSGAPATSPRRLRKPLSRTFTTENNEKESADGPIQLCAKVKSNDLDADKSFIQKKESKSQIRVPSSPHDSCEVNKPSRPKFLHLPSSSDKIELSTDLASNSGHEEYAEPVIKTITAIANINTATLTTPITINSNTQVCDYEYQYHSINLSMDNIDDNNLSFGPTSMPPLISSSNTNGDADLSYKNPVYQSAKQTSTRQDVGEHINCTRGQNTSYLSDHDIQAKISSVEENPVGTKGLLKWKGVMFQPDANSNGKTQFRPLQNEHWNEKMDKNQQLSWQDCEVFMVELTRGWNSRLGFSLKSRDNTTIISMVHPDSVAAKDGRLKQGDILIMVNDENVENVLTSDVIDLLRRIRGSIGITVARRKTRTVDT